MATAKKPKKKIVPAARLVLPLPGATQPVAMINTCNQQVATIEANPDIVNHPEVKAAANAVLTQAQTVGKTISDLGNARSLVTALETKRAEDVHQLRLLHSGLESTLNVAAKGDKAAATAWGGKLLSRTALPASTDAPVNPIATPTATMGTVLVKCKAERGATCYLMQTGTDPTHPEAWPAPVVASGAKHLFPGLTVGQKAYFRIAIVRRGSVQGQWSGVLEVVVR
jgi:hypothetical protein